MLLVPLCLRFSAYWAGCQIEGITCIFWLVEARESILKLVKNPSSQDLEQDENKTSFGLCFSSLWQMTRKTETIENNDHLWEEHDQ